MGTCAGTEHKKRKQSFVKETNVGVLQARIVHYIQRDQNFRDGKIEDMKIKIWLGSQLITSQLIDVLDKDKKKPTLKFYINSRQKQFGRSLNFELWNNKNLSRSTIPYGIYDLNALIQDLQESDHGESVNQLTAEVHMNCLDRQAGCLFVDLYFTKMPFDHLKFHISEVQLDAENNVNKEKKNLSYSLKFVIGEQLYETPVVQSSSNLIKFNMDTINFKVPRNLTQGTVTIIKKKGKTDIFVASSKINLKPMISSCQNLSRKQILKSPNNLNNSTIKFLTFSDRHITGAEITDDFQALPQPMKRHSQRQSNNVTSIRLIQQDQMLHNRDSIKEDQMETNDFQNRDSLKKKISILPSKQFSSIKLTPVEDTMNGKLVSGEIGGRESDARKSSNQENQRTSRSESMGKTIRLGSLPPKNIQQAMRQLAANKKSSKQLQT